MNISEAAVRAQFISALKARGINLPRGGLQADDEIHRADAGDDKNGKGDAAYLLHLNGGIPAGGFENHKDHLGWHAWRADIGRDLTSSEREAAAALVKRAAAKRDAFERHERAEAAALAKRLIEEATGDPATHPYQLRKKIPFGPLVKRGPWPQRGWRDALLVPLYDAAGKITTIEAISPTGDKDFLKHGKKGGSFHPIGRVRGAGCVRICEGLATATACAAGGVPSVAAMDAGNLAAVAQAVRRIAPNAEIVFGADNDVRADGGENVGVLAAEKAAQMVGGRVAVPELDGRKCDWWDVWSERSADEVEAGFDLRVDEGRKVEIPDIVVRKMRRVAFKDMKLRTVNEDLIKGFLPSGVGLLSGPTGSGKTFLAGEIALSLGTNRDFLGHGKRAHILVAYVSPEAPASVIQRFAAWREYYELEDASIELIEGSINVLNGTSFEALCEQLRELQRDRGAIGLIIIDTLSQSIPGADENGSEAMTGFVTACARLCAEFASSLLALHHTGKDILRGARGHSSLLAAMDYAIEVTTDGNQRIAKITKARDGVVGKEIAFTLRPIEIGVDQYGEQMTTCVVESGDANATSSKKPRGAIQILVWEALHRVVSTFGAFVSAARVPAWARAVTLDTLKTEAYSQMQSIESKHRSSRFGSALVSLNADGFVRQQDEWVWLPFSRSTPEKLPETPETPELHPKNTGFQGTRTSESGNRSE